MILDFSVHKHISVGVNVFFHKRDTTLMESHGHSFYEIFYIHNGSVKHELNSKIQILGKGDTLLIRPGDVHQYINPSKDFAFYNVAVSKSTMEKTFKLLDITGIKSSFKALNAKQCFDLENRLQKEIHSLSDLEQKFVSIELLVYLLGLFTSVETPDIRMVIAVDWRT